MIGVRPRARAVGIARRIVAEAPVYLDTETTGLDAGDEIVEICVLDHDGGVLVESLVRPRRPVHPEAARVHGLTAEALAAAPAWPEVWPMVRAAAAGRIVAIYNAAFDLRMMEQSHRVHGLAVPIGGVETRCIMELYAAFHGERHPRTGEYRWHRLDAAGRHCGIALPNAHRARADALLARAVLLHMAAAPAG